MVGSGKDEYITEHFKRSEFACKCGCGFDDIDVSVVRLLEALRKLLGKPIVVTSGCRCPTHNERSGGHPHSAHMDGLAVDIAIDSDADRWTVARWASFNGIGLAPTFIHLDIAHSGLPKMWLYSS